MSSVHIKIATIVMPLLVITACGSNTNEQVKVFKQDQSIQCTGGGISLDEMQLELTNQGIDVICAQKGHDGLARITVCEAPTGNLNIYTINKSNLSDAGKAGFKTVSDLTEYQDQECKN